MILCLDVGNSQIYAGVFKKDKLLLTFRHDTRQSSTSDQLGIFLRNVLRENKLDPDKIKAISISSVVPSIDYSLRSACIKYFRLEPFVLQGDVITGLTRKTQGSKLELGADRIANAVAGMALFPQQNLIIIDLGTATTYCAISANKEYLGGVIMAGMRLSMHALQTNTAKLFPVEIIQPDFIIGKTTTEHIQSGLYYGQLGAMKMLIEKIQQDCFANQKATIIGTGGFSHLFASEKHFDVHIPDLVLHGLREVWLLNHGK